MGILRKEKYCILDWTRHAGFVVELDLLQLSWVESRKSNGLIKCK